MQKMNNNKKYMKLNDINIYIFNNFLTILKYPAIKILIFFLLLINHLCDEKWEYVDESTD